MTLFWTIVAALLFAQCVPGIAELLLSMFFTPRPKVTSEQRVAQELRKQLLEAYDAPTVVYGRGPIEPGSKGKKIGFKA